MRLYRRENAGMVMTLKLSIAIAILCFGIGIPTLAQEVDTQTFTTEDQSFSFDHPADWTVEVINAEYGPNAHLSVDNMPLDQRFESQEAVNLQISLPTQSFLVGYSPSKTLKEAVSAAIHTSVLPASIDFATPSANQTPQPLELHPVSPDVTEFIVNGRSSAYGYSSSQVMGIDASQMFIMVDVGEGHWVSISATSFKGGVETLKRYESIIIALVQSMRYVPPPAVYSGNPDLPQVYSGLVGIWQRGYITFYYADDWYAYNFGMVGLSNKAENVINAMPQSGQFIAVVQGVSETLSSADPGELFNECDIVKRDLTARTLVEKMLGNITSAQLEQIKNAGIIMTQPEVTTSNGKEIVYMRQYQNDFEVLAMFIDLGGGNITSMSVTTKQGEMVQFEEQLFAVAGTFQYEPKSCDLEEMATPTGS
jgi:hypothetical protein